MAGNVPAKGTSATQCFGQSACVLPPMLWAAASVHDSRWSLGALGRSLPGLGSPDTYHSTHTATAEEFSNQALLQLTICPMEFLQNAIHPVAASHRSVLPSACSLPLCQPASSRLASPLDLRLGDSLLQGWEAPLCPAQLWALQKADAKHRRGGGLVRSLRGRFGRCDSRSPTQWYSEGEHHQPGLEAAPLMAPSAAITYAPFPSVLERNAGVQQRKL